MGNVEVDDLCRGSSSGFLLPGTRDLFSRVRAFAITIVIRGGGGDRLVSPPPRRRHLSQSQMKIPRIKATLEQGHDGHLLDNVAIIHHTTPRYGVLCALTFSWHLHLTPMCICTGVDCAGGEAKRMR